MRGRIRRETRLEATPPYVLASLRSRPAALPIDNRQHSTASMSTEQSTSTESCKGSSCDRGVELDAPSSRSIRSSRLRQEELQVDDAPERSHENGRATGLPRLAALAGLLSTHGGFCYAVQELFV